MERVSVELAIGGWIIRISVWRRKNNRKATR